MASWRRDRKNSHVGEKITQLPIGNNCVGPNVGNDFLQSVTAAVWKKRPPKNRLPPPNAEAKADGGSPPSTATTTTTTADSSKAPEPLPGMPVQSTPPEPVKMPATDAMIPLPLKPEKPASSHATEPVPGGGDNNNRLPL